jgi:transposase
MPRIVDDLSRALVAFEQDSTLAMVVELSQSSWLVAGLVPGLERRPLKKLAPDAAGLLALAHRWRDEAVRAGAVVKRLVVAFEAGRDGFWLARWLSKRGIETHVIHAASVAVSREHRRAKTDRLDTQLLMRALLGWLRGEAGHCKMAKVPTLEEEDDRRPGREREALVAERTRLVNRVGAVLVRFGIGGFKPMLRKAADKLLQLRTPDDEALPVHTLGELRRIVERLALIKAQIKAIEAARLAPPAPSATQAQARVMQATLARMVGVGVDTAELLTQELFRRGLRDRRAVARFAGLTGSPDESGARRREKGLARAGCARVRRGMIQLAWRFLRFQKDSALAAWFHQRAKGASSKERKVLIVALARKLLIALWRLATTGQVPEGVSLRPAAA